MATVLFDESMDKWKVMRQGSVVSTHNLARRAKEEGERVGRKYDEPVSYTTKDGTSTEYIYSPDASDQLGGNSGESSGGLFGGFL